MADPKSISPDPDSLTPDALTQERFYAFLQRLHLNPDQAARKYEELHGKLVKFFEWSSCVLAEDLADETLNRTARKLHVGDQNIQDVEAFTWGVAKHIRQEAYRKESRTVPLSDIPDGRLASNGGGSLEAIHSKIQRQHERQCLQACLGRLSPEDQELFLAYRLYDGHYLETRKRLAEKFGLTTNALRVRILRIRARLEQCMARCLGK